MFYTLAIALVFMVALPGKIFAREDSSPDCVVLIHGLGRTALSMKRLEWKLTRAGYHVVNVSYPSRRYSIETLAEDYLGKIVAEKIPRNTGKIHFVTHSMGGILLRQYLTSHAVTNLGNVVMLAPPNHGSEMVDILKRNVIGRWILGPAGCELGTTTNDLPQRLEETHFALGIIAGDRSFNPWASHVLTGPDDGKVSVESTKLAGMNDFLVVHNTHTWLMWRSGTLVQIMGCLRQGKFEHAS